MIDINNILKKYNGQTVLDIPSLNIKQGEVIGIVGNNGAGKTTLFSLILDLIKADEGQVLSNDQNVATSEHWKKYTSAFIDDSFLIDFLSPEEYFSFVGKLHNYTSSESISFATQFEEFFNSEVLGQNKYIRNLSKGNQKKVGLIGALIGNPELVILDEPFSNLDPSTQIRLKTLIKDQSQGKTFLVSSHDLNHVVDVSTRVIILDKGRVVKDVEKNQDSVKEIFDFFESQVA